MGVSVAGIGIAAVGPCHAIFGNLDLIGGAEDSGELELEIPVCQGGGDEGEAAGGAAHIVAGEPLEDVAEAIAIIVRVCGELAGWDGV